jgi:lipopolysaccharide transport system permease protein
MNLVRGNAQALLEAFRLLSAHRTLALEMARREVTERYAGQVLGLFWTVAHPLFMMGLYVFVFVVVFQTKISASVGEMPLDYTTYILAGLIPWLSLQESLSKSATALTSNANLIKQIVFPVELLPVKAVLATCFTQAISTLLLLLYVAGVQRVAWGTFLLVPVLMVLQLLLAVGLGFLLSSTGAFFRDTKDFVQIFALAGVYLVPVFYLPDWVPPLFKPVLYLNPFSYVTWCYQDAIYYGRIAHPVAWVIFPLLSIGVFVAGYRVMRRLKPHLGNVL